jgi:hypothetical protein
MSVALSYQVRDTQLQKEKVGFPFLSLRQSILTKLSRAEPVFCCFTASAASETRAGEAQAAT